ncbi:MAG: type I glyceraldehyde-3-phosphate dehydrogenase [bacterium]|nr:type I glyceraldehyde-3-phosphate dehydrogenase [bacterium]
MISVAINGFGRIGRNALRAGWGQKGMQFVALNDLTEPKVLAHLLKYDSVHRMWNHDIKATSTHLIIDGTKIPVFSEKDPENLPWKEHGVDVVIESTGFFTTEETASGHLKAGAHSVLISSPSKDAPTHLMGVNHTKIDSKKSVFCMASCTTNSTGPVVAIMREAFGVQKAMLSTIHSVTSGQNVVDGVPSNRKPDLRRARSILGNIIPTSTGAAKATALAIPAMKDKFDGVAIRVPVLDVSLSDFTFLTCKKVTVESVNEAFKKAAKEANWKKVLSVTNDPIVSSDIIGSPYGATVDLGLTRVVDGDLVKVMAWYDNEWGYSVQLIDMIREVDKSTGKKRK